MADEEAQNQEANAEATQGNEAAAGAEAAADASVEAAPAPSIWLPVIVSTVLSIGGAFALVQFLLIPTLKTSIKAELGTSADSNGSASGAEGGEATEGDESKKNGSASGGSDTTDPPEDGGADASPDESGGTINILEDGGSIVVNPAGSAGKVYLAVEIGVKRANPNDKKFKEAIHKNTKELEAVASDLLSSYDVTRLNQATIRDITEDVLKRRFNATLNENGEKSQIGKIIISKWIMQ